ncbi:hypothetical protein YQE_12947, partial [Dendroctonus ponderosae]
MNTCTILILLLLLATTEQRSQSFSAIRAKRSEHVPSLETPTFRRDSVEHIPEEVSSSMKASYMSLEEFGSKSLPLRTAVESVPDISSNSHRLPLRDAVERRPLPEESQLKKHESLQLQQPTFPNYLLQPIGWGLNSPSTFYSPANHFRAMISSYLPYRVSNGYQQLLISPFSYNRGRSLKLEDNVEQFENIADKKIVCYVEAAAAYRKQPLTFTPEDLDPYLCTHIIYAFASLDPVNHHVVSNDEEYDIVQGGYKAVVALKRFNRNLKVLLSIGGPRDEASHRFSNMISAANGRRDFIRSAFSLVKEFHFDGVEIHWEYPANEELGGRASDKENFQFLIEELSEVFKQSGLLVAVAAPASRFRIEDGFYPSKLNDFVDFVNVQTYDFHRDRDPVVDHHASLNARPTDEGLNIFLNADYAINFWIKNGLSSTKIILGVPFFGRTFTLQYINDTQVGAPIKGPGHQGFYTQKPGFLAYFEICDMVVNEGWYQGEDEDGSPYIVNGDQWVGYDNEKSIKRKIAYVKKQNLGGVFAWAADLDDFKGLCGSKFPLLNSINKQLRGKAPPSLQTDQQSPIKPFGTCESEGYYSDPKNCAGYYVCKNGLSYHLSCGNDRMFDSATGKCSKLQAGKCRPGEMVYIHQKLKKLNQELFPELLRDNEPKVVCYVTNWAFYRKAEGKFVPEHIDQRLCTHLVYAFASLDPETLLLKEFDSWADIDNNLYQRITSLKDTKVLLSLGGWTDSTGDKYSRLVSDGSARRRFVVGTLSFLRKHGFSGLHLDWNYPICWQSNCKKGPASDKPNFTKLLQELQREFDKQSPPLILAASISGYKEVIDVAYDLPAIGQALDFISVMTYDYHGAWEGRTGHVSPLYHQPLDKYPQYNTNFTMEYLVSKGAPRGKLLLGVPFYGQSFSLAKTNSYAEGTPSIGPGKPGEYTKQPGMLAYYEICYRIKSQSWVMNKGSLGSGPFAYLKDQWVGYEDIDSIKEKANYIRTSGFGGAVAWTIDLDDFNNRCCTGSFPLLHSLNEALGRISSTPVQGDCTKPPTPSTPAPPETTTGVDSGSATSEHSHQSTWTTTTTKRTTTQPWWVASSTSSASSPATTRKPVATPTVWWTTSSKKPTTSVGVWWTTSTQPSTWWSTSKSTAKPSTTPWWQTTQPSTTRPASSTSEATTTQQSSTPLVPPPAVIRPDNQMPPKSCEPGQYMADPNNCNAFYRCVGGELTKQYCAGGLHWNKNRLICDWPTSAKCKELQYSATSKPSTTQNTKSTPHHFASTPTTPLSHYSENGCETGAYYPHESCDQFYVCYNGHLIAQACAPGLNWDSEKGMCDWKFKVRCLGRRKLAEKYTLLHNLAIYRKQGQGKYLPEDIDANLCTHIVYGFAVLDFSNLIIKAHDSWADFDNQFYKRVVEYKAKGVKVSIAIGGWNDSQGDKYSRLVNNPDARRRFIEHIVKFLDKWGFDGLDLDWEYPKCWQVDCKKGPDSDKPSFSAFVKELKEAFEPKGYLLSAAVSPSKTVIDAGYDVPVLGKYLDWVAVMTYDFHGQWDKQTGHVAPLFYHPEDEVEWFNSNFSLHYWISEGVPRRKIVMGMPLYGQAFRLENETDNGLNAKAPGPGEAGPYTKAAGFLAYYEICDNIQNKGWKVVQDPKRRMGPYAYKANQWVSFDDREMIRIKSEFIRRMDLGGGMIWALDLDDFKNKCGAGRHPLLTTIRNVLADAGTGVPEPIPPIDNDVVPEQPQPVEAEDADDWSNTTHQAVVDQSSLAPAVPQATSQPLVNPNSEYKVVCYFTNWAWYRQGRGKYVPADIDPDLCTHVVYGFAVLNGDELVIKPHDSWADFDNKFYEKVTALKAKGIKVLIAIGGWNDSAGDKYSRLVNNSSARRRFVAHVVNFIEANNFDGLDLDWEYPKCWQVDCNKGPATDKPAFAELVKELHAAFEPKGWLLSAAVSPSKRVIDDGYDVPILSKYLSWIAVMTYDYHGQWDKITGHVAPMYTHPEDIDATFNAICTNIQKKGWKIVRDRQGRIGPYAYLRDQWVSFDDIGMIRHKSEYIKAMGLGGGMIWALDLDDFRNECGCEEYPLLRTINRVLRDYKVADPKCVLGKGQHKPAVPSKPSTVKPTQKPPGWDVEGTSPEAPQPALEACNGNDFLPVPSNCNHYYLCNQGFYTLQSCPSGLYWNKGHCDWPENTPCHPDSTTTEAPSGSADGGSSVPTVSTSIIDIPSSTQHYPSIEGEYKVVCYFTNWAWYRQGEGKYLPSDIDGSLCTHINYGFAVLDPNSLTIKPHDSWADIDNGKSKGIKVLIAIGGWNDSLGDKYSRLVNNPGARAKFISNVIEFIEQWGFDGLDLDWEYPKCWQVEQQVDCHKGPDSDKQGFASLVQELSQAFKPKGLLLSSAVSPSKAVIDAGYDVPALNLYFDWIAIMTYDFHGHWDKITGHVAPLYYYPEDIYDYFNANFSINYWIEKGADPKKLVMGMPLYGQSFTLADSSNYALNDPSYGPGEAGEFTRAGGFLAFYEICERVKSKSWTVKRDPLGRLGPYAHMGSQWVSYDDIADIRRKSQLVKTLGLGGGMIWALDLDDFRNRCGCGKHPLLKTLNHELRGTATDITMENCT